MNIIFKVSVVIGILMVSISIAYYFFIFLPKKEAQQNEISYNDCITKADRAFHEKWTSMCEEDYQTYQRCINGIVGKINPDDCTKGDGILNLIANVSPNNCRLPSSQLVDLNTSYGEDQKKCIELYSPKIPRPIQYDNQE